MKRPLLVLFFATITAAVAAGQSALQERYDLAYQAWDAGDYVKALEGFDAILRSPGGDGFLERIALVTGELFQTTELTTDGRSGRFSPSGKFIVYDTGTRTSPVVRILDAADPKKIVVEIRGANLMISPVADIAVYLKIKDTPEILSARKDFEALQALPSPDRRTLSEKQRQLAWLEAKNGVIVLYDIAKKKEKTLRTDGLLKSALAIGSDGRDVYFVGAKETDAASNDIYAVSETSAPRALTSGPGYKTGPLVVPGGKYLVYSVSSQNPFPKPSEASAQQTASPSSGRLQNQGGPPFTSRQLAVLNLVDGKVQSFTGAAPSFSAGGSALVFLSQEGNGTVLQFLKLGASLTPSVVKKSEERIGSAALAPDASGVVFDMPYARNGEIFYAGADGKSDVRISREIENDRAPRFLTKSLVLAVKGESRHSSSYLYDLTMLAATRIFHNNTLRTIAPEYEWAADPSGSRLLIQAERDGDTISPQRGIYLVDLSRKITMDALLARIADNLAAEKALRARGEQMFAPIASQVKTAVDKVSIAKLYEYQEKLFNFDSKHISQPGNKPAGEYIFSALKSFGYQPEYQEFTAKNVRSGGGQAPRDIKTANILAVLKGTENPDLIYVLSAHFDSNERGPGADDNSSATAVLLETARVLSKTPLPATVLFASFTGEEAGLLGSREFVRQAVEKKWRVMADINNDMIGWTNDDRLDNTIRYTNAGIRDIQHAAALLFSKLITYDTRYVKATDAQAFWDAYGDTVGGFGSYPVLGSPYYHLPTDLLENINHRLVEETTKATAAAVMMLASSPSPVGDLKATIAKDGTLEVTWAPNPEKGIAAYIVEYGPEGGPASGRLTVKEEKASVAGLKLRKAAKLEIAVKAVSERGIASWDWSRTVTAGEKKK